MMGSEGLTYCEGWMVGEQIPIPISHAWNILDNQVIDFTSTLWGRDDETRIYFGVVIPQEFVMQQMMETGVSGPYLYPYIMTQLNESSNSLAAESRVVTMASNSDYEVIHQRGGANGLLAKFIHKDCPNTRIYDDDPQVEDGEILFFDGGPIGECNNCDAKITLNDKDWNWVQTWYDDEMDATRQHEEFGAESCTCNDMFGSLCPQCNYDSDREGGVCPKGCTVDLAGSVRPQEMEIYTECKIHGQKLGAEEFGADGYGEMVYVKRL